MSNKTITLPRLNGLTPTLESTALKLMEETGELAQQIGNMRRLSGEQLPDSDQTYHDIARELLDVAQTAVTMMYVLEEGHNINIDEITTEHIEKLKKKGYIK